MVRLFTVSKGYLKPEATSVGFDADFGGVEKYPERNWEKGMDWSRVFGSLLRHAWKFWKEEDYDEETGCHHMAMVAWNAMALCSYSLRKIGKDNRPL